MRSRIPGPELAGHSILSLVVAQLPTFLIGAVAVEVQRELGFGAAVLGAIVAASLTASSATSVLGGSWAQRWGWALSMRWAAGITAATSACLAAWARTWELLAVLLVVSGLAKALAHPASSLAIAVEGRRRYQGLLFGLKQAGVPASATLAGMAVPTVAAGWGWRSTYWMLAVIALIAVITVPRRPRPEPLPGRHKSAAARRPGTRRADLIVISVASGLGVVTSNSVAAFVTSYGVTVGFSESTAGVLLATGSASGLLVRVVLGWRSDRARLTLRTVAVCLWGGTLGIILVSTAVPALVVVGVIVAFGAGWGWAGLLNALIVRRYPTAAAVTTGITQVGVFVGAGVGPLTFGLIAEHVSFAAAWWMVAACAAVAGIGMSTVARIWRTEP
jgi:MFS family permease